MYATRELLAGHLSCFQNAACVFSPNHYGFALLGRLEKRGSSKMKRHILSHKLETEGGDFSWCALLRKLVHALYSKYGMLGSCSRLPLGFSTMRTCRAITRYV